MSSSRYSQKSPRRISSPRVSSPRVSSPRISSPRISSPKTILKNKEKVEREFINLVGELAADKKLKNLSKLESFVSSNDISFNALDTALSMYENSRPPKILYDYLVKTLNSKYEQGERLYGKGDDNKRFFELYNSNVWELSEVANLYNEMVRIYNTGNIMTKTLINALHSNSTVDSFRPVFCLNIIKRRDIYYNMHFILAASNGATRQLQALLKRAYVIRPEIYQKAIKIATQLDFHETVHYLKTLKHKIKSYPFYFIAETAEKSIDFNKIEEPFTKV